MEVHSRSRRRVRLDQTDNTTHGESSFFSPRRLPQLAASTEPLKPVIKTKQPDQTGYIRNVA